MDFVMIWVDGNDPEWKSQFNKYKNQGGDKRETCFRDWKNLRYWFRGVEKFAPWVDNVYFVTCGHYPDWLNLDCPKLHFVRHDEFIPQEYLPTFSANTIELNLHRIKGLSDEFVYFNDDLFLVNHIKPTRFFKNGVPCDMAVLNALSGGGIGHMIQNDVETINQHCSKREVLKSNFFKWFSLKYGSYLLRTLFLLPWPRFTGFVDPHFPNPFCKKTYEEMWEMEPVLLHKTCSSRFRTSDDVNQYLMRYWQLVKGEFIPLNVFNDSLYMSINDESISEIKQMIESQKKAILVLNDDGVSDFDYAQRAINESFEKILPDKSCFEK